MWFEWTLTMDMLALGLSGGGANNVPTAQFNEFDHSTQSIWRVPCRRISLLHVLRYCRVLSKRRWTYKACFRRGCY